jgi:phenylalanyl-tRNA synthetase beta chain
VHGALVDRYPSPRGSRTIGLRRERLTALLGLAIPDADVVRILTALGLTVLAANDGWSVEAPTFRVDLLREVDLIEEVGRHYGFDKLEASFPVMRRAAAPQDPRIARDQIVRRVLTASGLSEAVTFGFIEAKKAAAFASEQRAGDVVAVANPLSATFDALRPSLLPGLLDSVAHNRRHGRRDVGLFEIGARFTQSDGESRGVAFAITGAAAAEHWAAGAREVDFFDAKGAVEALADALRVPLTFAPAALAVFVPGRSAHVLSGDTIVGVIGHVQPTLIEQAGAPRQDAVFAAELSLDLLAQHAVTASEWISALPRHPFVVRDLSIVVDAALPAEIIRGTIRSAAASHGAPLTSVAFFDRYQGKGVPEGSVSLSLRLTFQAADRTLTDAEVQDAFERILSALVREHGAVQR